MFPISLTNYPSPLAHNSPEEIINHTLDECQIYAQHLPENKKRFFNQHIKSQAKLILTKLHALSTCATPEQLKEHLSRSIIQLNKSAQDFCQSKVDYNQQKDRVQQVFENCDLKIAQFTVPGPLDFSEASHAATAPLWQDVMQGHVTHKVEHRFGRKVAVPMEMAAEVVKNAHTDHNPIRNGIVSGGTHALILESAAQFLPQRVPAYMVIAGANAVGAGSKRLESEVDGFLEKHSEEEYSNALAFAGDDCGNLYQSALATKVLLSALQLPSKALHTIHHTVTDIAASALDAINVTDRSVYKMLQAAEKAHTLEVMQFVHGLAVTNQIFDIVVSETVSGVVEQTAAALQGICNFHPLLKKGCQRAGNAVSDTTANAATKIQNLSNKTILNLKYGYNQFSDWQRDCRTVNDLYSAFSSKLDLLAKERIALNEQLGIPREKTRQFFADLPPATFMAVNISLGVAKIPATVVIKATQQPLKLTFKSPNLSRSKTLKVPKSKPVKTLSPAKNFAVNKKIKQQAKNLKKLLKDIKPFEMPTHFPSVREFIKNCELHAFKGSGLGITKKGSISGTLLYQPVDEHLLFVIRHQTDYGYLREKVGIAYTKMAIVNHYKLHWEERFHFILDNVFDLARQKGYKRVYLTWDKNYPFAVPMMTRSETILGHGTMADSIYSRPLSVLEVMVPN